MIKTIIAIFLSLVCSSACAHVSKANMNKIDPYLLIEIEKLKSTQQTDREVAVLIRTKKEITTDEKGIIEKEGGKIGSVIGDIMTVKIPVKALSTIADLDFVVYIEQAKKQQLR